MQKHDHESDENGEAMGRPNPRSGSRFLRLAAVPVAGVMCASAFAVAGPAAPASAHTGTLDASYVCVEDKAVITFSGATTSVPDSGPGHTATLTVGEIMPAGSVVSDAPSTVVGNTTYSFKLTVPGDATYAQATAFLTWGDGVKSDPIGKVDLKGDCKPTEPEVTVVAPTFNDVCGTKDDTYTVSASNGAHITDQSGNTVAPGTYPAMGTVTLLPVADAGNVLAPGTPAQWSQTFTDEPCPEVVVVTAPKFGDDCGTANDTYTVFDTPGAVILKDGQVVSPGTYPATGNVILTPEAVAPNTLAPSVPAQWSYAFTDEPCEEPSVGYAGTVSGDCTYGYGSASIDKNYDGRVKFTLWVGDNDKSFWVKPGDSGSAKLKGEPGNRVRLVAEGKNIAIGHMQKNCNTPNPECEQDCNPPSYECPTGEYWFDSNGDGIVQVRECKPAGHVDAGLGSTAPVNGGSSSGSGGGEQPNNGQRLLTGSVAVLERKPRVRRR